MMKRLEKKKDERTERRSPPPDCSHAHATGKDPLSLKCCLLTKGKPHMSERMKNLRMKEGKKKKKKTTHTVNQVQKTL